MYTYTIYTCIYTNTCTQIYIHMTNSTQINMKHKYIHTHTRKHIQHTQKEEIKKQELMELFNERVMDEIFH